MIGFKHKTKKEARINLIREEVNIMLLKNFILSKVKRILIELLIIGLIYLTAIFISKDTVFSVGLVCCIAAIRMLYLGFSNNVNGWGSLVLMLLLFGVLAALLFGKISFGILILLPLALITTVSAINNRMTFKRKST